MRADPEAGPRSESTPKIGLIEPTWWGGHHPILLADVAQDLLGRGYEVVVFSPVLPAALQGADDGLHHVEIPRLTYRNLRQGRQSYVHIVTESQQLGVTHLIDLFLDIDAIRYSRRARTTVPRAVGVLHHSSNLNPAGRRLTSSVKALLIARGLRGMSSDGVALVVHTEAVARRLADLHIAVDVVHPYPIRSFGPWLDQVGAEPPHRLTVLVAGLIRREKGVEALAEAAALLEPSPALILAGDVPRGLVDRVRALAPRADIEVHGPYEPQGLAALCGRSSVVWVGYTSEFVSSGGTATALHEAAALGIPALVSPGLAPQVPPGFKSAVVPRGYEPNAIAESLRFINSHARDLRQDARDSGPRSVQSMTMASYVDALLSAEALGTRW